MMLSFIRMKGTPASVLVCTLVLAIAIPIQASPTLKRAVMPKPVYEKLPSNAQTDIIVVKLAEGLKPPTIARGRLFRSGGEWNQLNAELLSDRVADLVPRFKTERSVLDRLRSEARARSNAELADLALYYEVRVSAEASADQRLALIEEFNRLDLVEIAYFAPKPSLATQKAPRLTPGWEAQQYYLQPAPTGVDAYAGWTYPGGKGDSIKVVDIEGNWIETHEDLHGGTDNFHIAGSLINDPGWWNHGTAVLGEIAADSNSFGMTGIAFNVDLGTVSIGSMSTASAITTATDHTEPGDIILIELHAPGPHYDFQSPEGQLGYVAMEYWQENFDAILQASVLGRIVVEAGGNGAENFDDTTIYGHLFDPAFRFSGAVMVAASNSAHYPASFTNYGQRMDCHAFGTWDVYTLGYGDLYGSSADDYYTGTFAGTSSASPIIVGACAVLQGIHKAAYGTTMMHDQLRTLLTTYSTPQASSPKLIGPLPDLSGSSQDILGVTLSADTTFGWAPLEVNFSGASGLEVDEWVWDFGNGDSAFVQNPSYSFYEHGMFDITLQVTAGTDVRTMTRAGYIVALGDTLAGETVAASEGDTIEVLINAVNTVFLKELNIPLEYSGTLDIEPIGVGWTTDGCRTAGMDLQEQTHWYPYGKQMTVRLANTGSSSHLPPGEGPVLKLLFEIDGTPTVGQDAVIQLSGYNGRLPEFDMGTVTYEPITPSGLVTYYTCCNGIRGNIDDDAMEQIVITDLVYLVTYMFQEGPAPSCMDEANVDGDVLGTVDIADLVRLVTYMFQEGVAPADCN